MTVRDQRAATVFLLSPANLGGTRARQLTSRSSSFEAALEYRNGGVPIARAFAFMSALYFRGKITYAERFARPPEGVDGGVRIITGGYGLVPPDWTLNEERMRRLRRTKIDPRSRTYRKALRDDLLVLAEVCPADTQFVLLGSIATGKYLDVLEPVLGERLRFPAVFAGMGDMQRGSVMLKAVRAGEELEYVGLRRWKMENEK